MRFNLLLLMSMLLTAVGYTPAASPPSQTIFPATTKGWVSVPDVDALRGDFRQTQLGLLTTDEAVQPFLEDFQKQLQEKFADLGVKMGLELADLEGVYSGEVALAAIQPNPKDLNSHALALAVDVTDRTKNAKDLLAKINKNLTAKGAKQGQKKLDDSTITVYTLPLAKGETTAKVVAYVLEGNTLLACDHLDTLMEATQRLKKHETPSLATNEAFSAIRKELDSQSGQLVPHAKWFVEPLGFAEVNRAAAGGKKKRGTDPLVVLRKQGLTDLQGVGGNLHFHTQRHEAQHQVFVYAPAAKGAKPGLNYRGMVNIFDFPNAADLEPQGWVPMGVSTYLSFHWQVEKAFEHFGPLFDGFTEPGTFDEILVGLAEDPAGPQTDIRKEIVALLGTRVTLLTDYHLPIDIRSERLLVAGELKPGKEKDARAAIEKLMKHEPNARKISIENQEAWEIVERIEEAEVPTLDIDGPGFVVFEPGAKLAEVAVVAKPAATPPDIVICVAKGHIFVTTHGEFLGEVLKDRPADASLSAAQDYKNVAMELKQLGSEKDSFHFFTRTDEAYRPTYELMKKNKLPVAETMLARLLNRLITSDKKGEVRHNIVDGGKLPQFEAVRKYFGPGGFFVKSVENGWRISGCLIKQPEESVAKVEK